MTVMSTSHGRLREKNGFMTFRENPAHAQAVDTRPSPRGWGLGTRLHCHMTVATGFANSFSITDKMAV